ncbi:hypothetical protein A943_10820 [Bacillus sp. CPSM8]|uniref:hypothetical protein n=1 Tax=Bacillus paralicheniformis TaxID=1648923 RepID=UPI0003D1CD95|nr:hypothetical protein [Bacillus paralicheniformis]ETB71210.1 hypothetical protein A943_10820 [Bacillus sp. CPSM8]MDR9798553.1 hypothetical protein [Bacillus paralicheniformis]QSF97763.1 hypothetical protein DI291_05160 [Bacillus paralicheniformis]
MAQLWHNVGTLFSFKSVNMVLGQTLKKTPPITEGVFHIATQIKPAKNIAKREEHSEPDRASLAALVSGDL